MKTEIELVYRVSDEDLFDSLEKAMTFIGEISSDADDAIGAVIDVYEKVAPSHGCFFSAEGIIEDMQNSASDNYSEWADDYLNDVEFDNEKLKSLSDLLSKWFDENAKQPLFFQSGKHVSHIVVDEKLLTEHGVKWE